MKKKLFVPLLLSLLSCLSLLAQEDQPEWPTSNGYVYFGSKSTLDQSIAGNYALLQKKSNGQTFLNSPNQIQFRIDNSDKMTLKSSGYLGIGTDSPNRNLTIFSGTKSFLNLKTTTGYEFLIGADQNGGIISTMSNHDLQIRAGSNSTKMIVKANGDVGIGTTSPSVKLEVDNPLVEEAFKLTTGTDGRVLTLRGETINFKRAGSNYIAASNSSGALNFSTGGSDIYNSQIRMRITSNGNVGIGTTSPDEKLHVHGNVLAGSTAGAAGITDTGTFGSAAGVFIGNAGSILDNNNVALNIASRTALNFYVNESSGNSLKSMHIKTDGNVGIGTDDPQSKLAVDGQIRASEIKVLTDVNSVPDYVFEPDYNLRTLKETKQYITENKHLPEIPSAEEIGENGIDLGDMNMRLLKKIEELTLYQIELLERLEKAEGKISRLEEK